MPGSGNTAARRWRMRQKNPGGRMMSMDNGAEENRRRDGSIPSSSLEELRLTAKNAEDSSECQDNSWLSTRGTHSLKKERVSDAYNSFALRSLVQFPHCNKKGKPSNEQTRQYQLYWTSNILAKHPWTQSVHSPSFWQQYLFYISLAFLWQQPYSAMIQWHLADNNWLLFWRRHNTKPGPLRSDHK